MNPLETKHILLGVTGSIAAYKAADLASKLTQAGATVQTILTAAAEKFVSPLTFQSVTGQRAYTDGDLWGNQAHVLHVGLAHQADMLVIAPATAQTISKLANGLADNLLCVTALACGTGPQAVPMLMAPAMDAGMFSHAATQASLATLRERGAILVGPEEGHLASGLVAKGRMSEPATILGVIRYKLSRTGPLAGIQVVVTAGGTQEEIDPVRFITNRSSGKQGYALAQAALDAGAEVTLVSAPTQLHPPSGVHFIPVRSADQMAIATLEACQGTDALIMAAAVADFRPAQTLKQKIKKDGESRTLGLQPTPDILMQIAKLFQTRGVPRVRIGFAAETEDLLANAARKQREKDLDLIVANDVSTPDSGFEVDTNRVTFLFADGSHKSLPLLTKAQVAEQVIQELVGLLKATG